MKAILVKSDNLLSDPATPWEVLKALVEELKAAFEFGEAARGLRRLEELHFPWRFIRQPPEELPPELREQRRAVAVWVQQQLAFCTYKDDNVHAAIRLPAALQILEDLGLRDPEQRDAQTISLAGAVYKRLWQYRHKVEDLYASLAFYERAWQVAPEQDLGYGGVNAAFLLDVLAHDARSAALKANSSTAEADALADRAYRLRLEVRETVLRALETASGRSRELWCQGILAEAAFGLALRPGLPRAQAAGLFAEAGRWLADATRAQKTPWHLQATVRQCIKLATLAGVKPPRRTERPEEWHPAWQALQPLLGARAFGTITAHGGKVGLALSGGGFRASLFHLGVLARLAEMDVLRRVEVLSTVSGGSIVGAHYYLELKRLLETTADADLTREHYLEAVRRVQHNFLHAVQQNLRVRALGSWWSNFKVAVSSLGIPWRRRHTRSIQLARLYQRYIYDQVPVLIRESDELALADQKIAPLGEGPKEEFRPAQANWRREAKVPVLLLNATSLNSGHNFQFTASFLGEPPSLTGAAVDLNARYRRVYYDDLSDEALRRYPLGQAVAASACVPGLFEPLELYNLYPGEHVRLVDGGVHDNQGVAGLLDEDCTLILCSDASGCMDDQSNPDPGRLGALLRTSSILQDRVREAQFQDLQARCEAGTLDGLFFIHLKQDLDPDPIDWVDCQDPTPARPLCNLTPYGIDRDLQLHLANLRTDLDSFTEVEAYALMQSGYEMTRHQFEELARAESAARGEAPPSAAEWCGFMADAPVGEWPFQVLAKLLQKPKQTSDKRRADLEKQLAVGAQAAFKIWRLNPVLGVLAKAGAVAAVVIAIVLVTLNWNRQFEVGGFTLKSVLFGVGLPLAACAVPALAWLTPLRHAKSFLLNLTLITVGWLLAWIHLWIFDRLFLNRGKVQRLLRLPTS